MRIPIGDIELCLWQGAERPPASSDSLIYLHKDPAFLDRLDAIVGMVRPKRMIEVGILDGGSTIYWQDRYRPNRLLTFDIEPDAPHLVRYLQRHDLTGIVRTHFGVSQNNRSAIQDAIAEDMVEPVLDLIIDDASHQYGETRATVEILLPFLRPGGAYIIEDWAWGHHVTWPREVWTERPLMSPLLSELMLVCGSGTGIIDRMEIDPNFAVLWRGNLDLVSQGEFRIADHHTSRDFAIAL